MDETPRRPRQSKPRKPKAGPEQPTADGPAEPKRTRAIDADLAIAAAGSDIVERARRISELGVTGVKTPGSRLARELAGLHATDAAGLKAAAFGDAVKRELAKIEAGALTSRLGEISAAAAETQKAAEAIRMPRTVLTATLGPSPETRALHAIDERLATLVTVTKVQADSAKTQADLATVQSAKTDQLIETMRESIDASDRWAAETHRLERRALWLGAIAIGIAVLPYLDDVARFIGDVVAELRIT